MIIYSLIVYICSYTRVCDEYTVSEASISSYGKMLKWHNTQRIFVFMIRLSRPFVTSMCVIGRFEPECVFTFRLNVPLLFAVDKFISRHHQVREENSASSDFISKKYYALFQNPFIRKLKRKKIAQHVINSMFANEGEKPENHKTQMCKMRKRGDEWKSTLAYRFFYAPH